MVYLFMLKKIVLHLSNIINGIFNVFVAYTSSCERVITIIYIYFNTKNKNKKVFRTIVRNEVFSLIFGVLRTMFSRR